MGRWRNGWYRWRALEVAELQDDGYRGPGTTTYDESMVRQC